MPFDPLPYLAPVFVLALVIEGIAVRYSPRARGGARDWFGPPETSSISSAGHAPRPSERAGLLGTWLPLAGGFAAAMLVAVGSLPTAAATLVGVAGIVLLEIACSPLDRHR